MTEGHAVEAHGVVRTFTGPGGDIRALDGVDLVVAHRTMVAVRGRSGSGKTTLLNLIGALDRPTSGAITVLGERVDRLAPAGAATWRAASVGFVFQAHGLMHSMTAYENVELVLRIAGLGRRDRVERAMWCLDAVGLLDRRNHRPSEMSGGQRQRVAVARAIAPRNRLLIADEPTAGLDSSMSSEVLSLLRGLVDEGVVTVVMATHDPMSDGFVDAVTHLEGGVLVRDR